MATQAQIDKRKALIIRYVNDCFNDETRKKSPSLDEIACYLNSEQFGISMEEAAEVMRKKESFSKSKSAETKRKKIDSPEAGLYKDVLLKQHVYLYVDKMDKDEEILYIKGQIVTAKIIEKKIRDFVEEEYNKNQTPVSKDQIISSLSSELCENDLDRVSNFIENVIHLFFDELEIKLKDGGYIPAARLYDNKSNEGISFAGMGEPFVVSVNELYDKTGAVPHVKEVAKNLNMPEQVVEYMLSQFPEITVENGKVFTGYIREQEATKSSAAAVTTTIALLPIYGPVACGEPEEVRQSNALGQWPFPTSKLEPNKKFYFLKASGDSMKDVGITDGCYVLIEETKTAEPGDIVVAKDEKEGTTLKRLLVDRDGKAYLHPENPDFEDIYLDEITIQGKYAGYYCLGI